MLKTFNRAMRLEQCLHKEIAIIVRNFLRDPRIYSCVTILEVKLSSDLNYAKIFFTSLNLKDSQRNHLLTRILQKSSGFIRFHLGKTIYLRTIPKLFFIYDDSFLQGITISKILRDNL
ncbi:30S ribosome-binding factor RbfA [Buchnera aphidicola]|uniref:30S ribosome-binding factor RbfA n=1 Tax=Buchnera aphidicola TaxID=9 RepID=UPI00094C3207|nr:30S ribosome-binding factor RbfA [Buchnera aphidicola]